MRSLESKGFSSYRISMNVVLPERFETCLSPQEVRLDLAVGMYSSGRVTLGTAAEVADLCIPEFQRELGRRRIPVNYTTEDLAFDLQAATEIARQ
jgi:predicted HTH domain antitoxin